MRGIIGCECSGVVREAFRRRGHDVYSCDLKPSEDGGPHIQDDILEAMMFGWDFMIAHPDCTYTTVANNGHISHGCSLYSASEGQRRRELAVDFFLKLVNAPIDRIALEQPVSVISTRYRKPEQVIQPWQFGDDASKATCLWLEGFPLLVPTNVLPGGRRAIRANQTPSRQNRLGPSPTRKADRARTYPGIAAAMAAQWT